MTHGSLFSGIGGFDLAAEWMGWENIFHCEWNDFGQKVLHHYWPKAISYHDITKTDFTIHRGRIDILTGGFPCQPYSMAGKRKGKEDERHLWPEMLRAIKEIQPRWVVGENVYGLVNWSNGLVFHEVQADLEAAGYEVFPYVLPAVSVNAPHRRDRIWFVAYAKNYGCDKRVEDINGREEYQSCNWDKVRNITTANGEQRTTPHPNRNPTGTSGESASIEGIGGSNDVQQSERRSKTKFNNRPSSVPRDATAPNRNGFNGSDCQHEIQPSEGGEYAQCNFEQNVIANTESIGQGNALENGELERGRFRQPNQRNAWDSFPSVSPICTGDDGVSSRLDNITFSKWRNESIKAAGNAIVPQVALQIFKTIQQYETLPRMAATL